MHSLRHLFGDFGVEVLHNEAIGLLLADLPVLVRVGGVDVLVRVARGGRGELGVEISHVALLRDVVAHDHAKHDRRVALHDLPISKAAPDELLHTVQALGIGKVGEGPVRHPSSTGVIEVLGHAHVAPGAPLRCHGGLPHRPAMTYEPIKEGVGGGIVQLSHVAIDSARREDPEELDWILEALESIVDVECSTGLGVEGGLKFLPSHVEEHAILQHTRRVDDAAEVWSVLFDPAIHIWPLAEIQRVLLNFDTEILGH
mmetsp:Transcript_5120/g.10561  ORF Transcript_5120/g.10561 Transcript_5120/m.10561 type:complete len:257 (+) Transcript_5120:165-935(+)